MKRIIDVFLLIVLIIVLGILAYCFENKIYLYLMCAINIVYVLICALRKGN